MKPILAPHKEQDGWVYVRVESRILDASDQADDIIKTPRDELLISSIDEDLRIKTAYNDNAAGSRVISSRKVEDAVETADYLKRCAEEGLWAGMDCAGDWCVAKSGTTVGYFMTGPIRVEFASPLGVGTTLREAYWRYKNAVAR